jgi:hypothetical protein
MSPIKNTGRLLAGLSLMLAGVSPLAAQPLAPVPILGRLLPPTATARETRSPDDFELFLESVLEAPRGPRTAVPVNPAAPSTPACWKPYTPGGQQGQQTQTAPPPVQPREGQPISPAPQH